MALTTTRQHWNIVHVWEGNLRWMQDSFLYSGEAFIGESVSFTISWFVNGFLSTTHWVVLDPSTSVLLQQMKTPSWSKCPAVRLGRGHGGCSPNSSVPHLDFCLRSFYVTSAVIHPSCAPFLSPCWNKLAHMQLYLEHVWGSPVSFYSLIL